ncbi:DUF305 domain-containing protein [Nocardia sp. NPDC127606]|uniref:DUF305 domain-containing protein n=1 Tax=Nocardia sp. NPDC127606 TaxID=3345406 RepID=UPI003625D2F2
MTQHNLFRAALLAGLALLLLAMGMALRPVLIPGDAARDPLLNATEIGFVQDMVAHHSQALLLVQRLDRGVEPSVAALADQIADTQRAELGMLLGWLRLANAPVTAERPMAWMAQSATHRHRAASPDSAMPGMATTAELDQLAAARAGQAEVLFLQLMRRHHYGGVEMAADADALLTGGEVERTARGMVTEQGREAGLLDLLLARRGV